MYTEHFRRKENKPLNKMVTLGGRVYFVSFKLSGLAICYKIKKKYGLWLKSFSWWNWRKPKLRDLKETGYSFSNNNESPKSTVLKALTLVTHKLCPPDGYQCQAGPSNYAPRFRKMKYLELFEEAPKKVNTQVLLTLEASTKLTPQHLYFQGGPFYSRNTPIPIVRQAKSVRLPQLFCCPSFPFFFFTICFINIPTLTPKTPKKIWRWYAEQELGPRTLAIRILLAPPFCHKLKQKLFVFVQIPLSLLESPNTCHDCLVSSPPESFGLNSRGRHTESPDLHPNNDNGLNPHIWLLRMPSGRWVSREQTR